MHAEFEITVPKFDNEGHRISTEKLSEIAIEMSKYFGGVTIIPKIIGCYLSETEMDEKGEKKMQCEENAVYKSYRIGGTAKQLEMDRKFIENLSSKIGKDFGQEAILGTEDDTTHVSWSPGKKKEEVPKSFREINAFSQLVD